MKQISPGIYFGLDEATYHDDPAFGSNDVKDLAYDHEKWFERCAYNPDRTPYKETEAYKEGKLKHLLLLEPEEFDNKYCIQPGSPFQKGKKIIGRSEYEKQMRSIDRLKNTIITNMGDPMTVEQFMGNGLNEVSIFWRDEKTKLMCKARHDVFKPYFTVDYKTCREWDIENTHRAIERYKYYVQAAHYINGRKAIRDLLKQGGEVIFGDVSDLRIIQEFAEHDDDGFFFVFQCKDAPYKTKVHYVDQEILELGQRAVNDGLERFVLYADYFEKGECPPSNIEVEEISIFQFSHNTINKGNF